MTSARLTSPETQDRQDTLYTLRLYPCGCHAYGPGNVPAYCLNHGTPPSTPAQSKEYRQHLERILEIGRSYAAHHKLEWCAQRMYDVAEEAIEG